MLLLSSDVHLGLPYDLFSSGFETKILCSFRISVSAICCARLILLDLSTLIIFG